jgi:TolA-binding protein
MVIRSHMLRRFTLLLIVLVAATVTNSAVLAGDRVRTKGDIQRSFTRVQRDLIGLEQTLGQSDGYAATMDGVIIQVRAQGQETKSLEDAVASFRTRVGQMRSSLISMQGMVQQHAGFNAQGIVLDRDVALSTVQSIRSTLGQVDDLNGSAYKDLHAAIKTYQKTYPDAEFREPTQP